MAKKYYWLKLKEGFFGQKEIKKLRKIAGGDTYTVIYLKMLLSAIKQGNRLYFEGVEENFPEELALELDEDPENVKMTLAFLERQGLIQIVSEDEFLLTRCEEMVGSETDSAIRVRKSRENKALQCNTDVTGVLQNGNTEIEIEKDKDKEKELEIEKDICSEQCSSEPQEPPVITLPLNSGDEYAIYQRDIDTFTQLYPAVDVLQAFRGMKGWLLTNTVKRKTKRGIGRFINSWLAREQDKGGTRSVGNNARKMTTEQYAESIRGWNS